MKTVITYGTFDMFHVGHLRILERAKTFGDRLIVGVSTDEFNDLKGKKTLIPFEDRAEIVASLSCVDGVIAEKSWDQKHHDIKTWNVDVFVMGDDWAGKFDEYKTSCQVFYLPRTEGISTTMLKTEIRSLNSISLS